MTKWDKSKLPSRHTTVGPERAPHRSYYYAMGLTKEEIEQPFVGVATCWKSDTGDEMWKERLGGTFSGSLTLVGDKLYTTNESGTTFVFRANPEKFEKLGENSLPGEAYATPVVCGGRVYLRIAEFNDGQRQEMLYCIGKK